jgi:hypothetical protein
LLDKLAQRLPQNPSWEIVIFGSAPLQLMIDSQFLSNDCDILGDQHLREMISDLSESSHGAEIYFQVCDPLTFRTAMGWDRRCLRIPRGGHVFIFPHPWDILTSKIARLEEKDIEAFELVIKKTGHPSSDEFKMHLRMAVDLFRPNFDEEQGRDFTTQTQFLWQRIFGQPIDVRKEIIIPALALRKAQYSEGEESLKQKLRGDHLF